MTPRGATERPPGRRSARPRGRCPWLVAGAVAAALATPGVARAQAEPRGGAPAHPHGEHAKPAVILPTAVLPSPRRGEPGDDREAVALAASLDALLTDTAQDLGLSVDLGGRSGAGRAPAERELLDRARAIGGTIIAPSLSIEGGEVELRIVFADASARALRVRVERVSREDMPVRAVIMLRDLVVDGTRRDRSPRPDPAGPATAGSGTLATPARSAGRTTLAVNATLFGGFVGYSILRSSGSEDPRLLYPLLAVGSGVGLGGSIIAAEEWDVGVGDAWYLSAGAFWPTLAGHLLWEGRFSDDGAPDERWAFGLVGGTAGITLATLALAAGGAGEGGATVAHSGGGLGLIFGGLTELFARGDIYRTPFAGMGYGAGIGWLAAAAVGRRMEIAPGRVLAIDLGALLGGLGGAALASPLLFDEPTKTQQRGWLGATAGAALVGAGIAWYTTREPARADAAAEGVPLALADGAPLVGVLGESAAGGRSAPIVGLGWRGAMR